MTVNQRRADKEEQKFKKTVAKALRDVRSKHPDVTFSDTEPTNILFAVHTSFRSAAMFPDVNECIKKIVQKCHFLVFPLQCDYKEYIFIVCENKAASEKIYTTLNGQKPEWLKESTSPFHINYASNVPTIEQAQRIPGFHVINNVISDELESKLKDYFDSQIASATLKNRTVIHYGHKFDYGTNTAMVPTDPIPQILIDLLNLCRSSGVDVKEEPDQITVNIYEPSQGIPSHVDTHSAFEEQITIINLLSDVVMKFTDCANKANIINLLMPRKSVVVMEDAVRYKYRHGILNRRYDICPDDNRLIERQRRISITYRKIRRVPCECPFPEFCDWDRNGLFAVPNGDKSAQRLEDEYVSNVYENIAGHFDVTRHSKWPAFSTFVKSFPSNAVILDAGCGNGKYLEGEEPFIRIGSDICANLLKIASTKGYSVFRSDLLALPLKAESFDGCLCAAVVHHFSTEERRLRAFVEIHRILRVGGRALVSGWSMDQKTSCYGKMRANRVDEEIENAVVSDVKKLQVHDGAEFTQQDVLVPWDSEDRAMNKQFLRYYHLFVDGEMPALVSKIPNCRIIRSFAEQGNWFIEFEKL